METTRTFLPYRRGKERIAATFFPSQAPHGNPTSDFEPIIPVISGKCALFPFSSRFTFTEILHRMPLRCVRCRRILRRIWKIVIRGGDTVVDATCGNGYDTIALLKLVADDSRRGCVHGLDIQSSALENTCYLLRESVAEKQRELVKLHLLCHSRMEDILPKDAAVRLIAFNLGYLPAGDKAIITKPHTTLFALQAASRIIASGGLISIVIYIGHPGGREELEAVLSFASSLAVEGWNCFKFETANRSTGPVLVFIIKK
ncbi:uncharacterized protein LOC110103402 isoform X3 [Dendrobium catenatum]|uniref:uncharacterized protein LOC110103402 isoform X3 n=1 Tax=Dendrobium catenatum TaxID=906689 RepID=UPI00109F2BFD|nr:uncharacterized protein LOC110103402 isoform X3 [Dendrobium catenatum]